MPFGERHHRHCLLPSKGPAQAQRVADFELPVGFAVLTVDLDFAAVARALRFRARTVETRHVEPDIQTNGVGLGHRG